MASVLFLGTCRVYRSAFLLETRFDVARSPHRFHTPLQIIRALDHHVGKPVWPTTLDHVISRKAINLIRAAPLESREALAALQHSIGHPKDHDAFIVEVSSLTEHYGRVGEREYVVNTLVAGDLTRHGADLEPLYESGRLERIEAFRTKALTLAETRKAMQTIKQRLGGKPIVWVSQANVTKPSASEAQFFKNRSRLVERVGDMAQTLGDPFIDPTELVAARGRKALFKNDGKDLTHYTPRGQHWLADRIIEALDRALAAR